MKYEFSIENRRKNENLDLFYINITIINKIGQVMFKDTILVKFDNNTKMVLFDNKYMQNAITVESIRLDLIYKLKTYIREVKGVK